MAKTALKNATSFEAYQDTAKPTPAGAPIGEMGEAGSKDSLARLNEAMRELKAVAAAPVLRRAIESLNREDFVGGGKWAIKALELDEHNGVGWYLLAIARERAGDFVNSVRAYEAALKLLPEHADVANDLGRLAFRMGMFEQAEKLFIRYIEHAPERADGVNNLASALRDQGRHDEAIELLRNALMQHPEAAILWNTLASAVMDIGDLENAYTFFSEAIRLSPKFGKARYNLGQCKHAMGDTQSALDDCIAALKRTNTAEDRQMMLLARSTYNIVLGNIGPGWDDYEARLSAQFAGVTHFVIDRPKWKPGKDLAGKTFLVVAEQGLGDELLFANVLPDIVEKLGPDGRLLLAVEKRLVPLFQRSFPDAEVTPHSTKAIAGQPVRYLPLASVNDADLWTPMGSLMREFRRTVDAFPDHKGYLKADPERVDYWRQQLETAPAGPKVGLLWKSAVTKGRSRYFSPFEQWAPVLRTPGVSFVNLQYGDCAAELEQAERDFGVKIWQPDGIDLKNDLDDVAALCCAMDLTVGFSNATFNIASSCGAPTWLISTPGSWPRLGTDRYPWYPQTRVFLPDGFNAWGTVMEPMAEALAEWAKAR